MGAGASDSVVRVSSLNHFFGTGDARNQVLHDNNLEIGAGQLVIMTGPSGSGKTTLLTLIGALRSVQQGKAEVLGRDLAGFSRHGLVEARRDIGFIFQSHNLFESLSAYENVKMAMQLGKCPPKEMRRRGTDVLTRLGLEHRVDYKPRALSGGQRQRVACARAIVNRPKLILADEPTAALDKEASRNVVGLFKELAQQSGTTIIMVTHDNRILEYADRIINMVDGHIVSDVVLREVIQIGGFLKDSQIFSDLSPSQIANVAEFMKRRRYDPGETIIRLGDVGDEFFILSKGSVGVFAAGSPEGERVATLTSGQFFGERALITGEPRNSTITADNDVETFVLGKADFNKALLLSASFKDQLLAIFFQRH